MMSMVRVNNGERRKKERNQLALNWTLFGDGMAKVDVMLSGERREILCDLREYDQLLMA